MLRMLDTAGQEEFTALSHQYIEQAEAFLVGYDVTSTLSFGAISRFISAICETLNCEAHEISSKYPVLIVGNKIDLESKRTVTTEEGKQFADSINAMFIETSVKTRINIDESIDLIVNDWVNKFSLNYIKTEYLDDLNVDDETCLKTCKSILENNVKPKIVQALLCLVIQNEFQTSFEYLLQKLELGHGTIFPINGSYYLHEAVKKGNILFIKALLEFHSGTRDLADSNGNTPNKLSNSVDIIRLIHGDNTGKKCYIQ